MLSQCLPLSRILLGRAKDPAKGTGLNGTFRSLLVAKRGTADSDRTRPFSLFDQVDLFSRKGGRVPFG